MSQMQRAMVLDLGGPFTQLVARRVREQQVYCEVMPYGADWTPNPAHNPLCYILCGVKPEDGADAPKLEALLACGVPVLGVGYGAALLAPHATCESKLRLLPEQPVDGKKTFFDDGLHAFLFDTCKAKGDWTMPAFIEDCVAAIRAQVGEEGRVLLALSGGVDSSVCAALIYKAIGSRLHCVFVNHGFMRKQEPEQVHRVFTQVFPVSLIAVDAVNRFQAQVEGVTDPELKRKRIGAEFIEVFAQEARKLGKIDFLAQGTIYPDIIESGGLKGGKVIKSHHNVGGLPQDLQFTSLVEPLKYLFKDEVRRVGEALGLPEGMVWRQPFPGPGLAVRVIGAITQEKLHIVREADAIVREEIAAAGLDKGISQYFALLTGLKSVGVRGEARSYDYTVGIRAVVTSDFMAADWARIPHEVLAKMSSRIVAEVANVNRVVYDITAKPPATVEWE